MSAYTIEDIELIRRKSGISYQEAVALLDYHNGNVARALVDLERNGRINPQGGHHPYQDEQKAKRARTSSPADKGGSFWDLLTKGYRARITIKKDETPVLNISVLFGLLSVLISPHLVIIGAIVCLVLGYKFSFVKSDAAFAGENLDRMVRSAAENVKSSVNDFAKGFQSASQETSTATESGATERSYYAARSAASAKPETPAATYRRPDVPTLNVPVQVESQDGKVTLESEDDGFSSATVE